MKLGRMPAITGGFTLMETLIAVGILFMCLFAVLALVSNSLTTARKLQQHKSIDTSTIASMIYVMLSNTNRVDEGEIPVDLAEVLPGYNCYAELNSVGTNGLAQIDFEVHRNQEMPVQGHFLMYLPSLKPGTISSSLPSH